MSVTVVASIVGGSRKLVENVSTVGDVRRKMKDLGEDTDGHTAKVNGNTADDSQSVADNAFVTFAKAVKGA